MRNTNRLVPVFLVMVALVSTVALAYRRAERPEMAGRVVLSARLLDFGTIPMEDGPVSGEVTVTNAGEADLEIHRLSTSCGCTTAEMDLSVMRPGESRTLTVTFDPMVHPDLTGPIVRVVYLQTSDVASLETEIDVRGTVTKKTPL